MVNIWLRQYSKLIHNKEVKNDKENKSTIKIVVKKKSIQLKKI